MQEMDFYAEWLSLKLERRLVLSEPRTAEGVYDQIFPPMRMYARVKLAAEPAAIFGFRCAAIWPENRQIHYVTDWPTNAERDEQSILDGILDELLAGESGDAVTGVHLTLLEVECGKLSPPAAFYQGA